MQRIPKLHALTAALLGLAFTVGAALPVAAQDGSDRRAERMERRLQKSGQAAEAAPAAPAAPQAQRNDAPRHFEHADRPANRPRSSDDARRENWGELARQQRERQAAQEPRGAWQRPERVTPTAEPQRTPEPRIAEQRELRRQQVEDRQVEQRQRIADQRDRLRQSEIRQREQATVNSPQARVIAEARQREANRDWRDDRRSDDRRDDRRDDRHDRRDWRDGERVSREQQRHRMEEQRRRHAQLQRDDDRRRHDYDRHRHQLERQRRNAQVRYQQDYWRRWLAAQSRWNNDRYDYDRDPYFSTPYNYRYNYGGRWYSTNSYGAEMLRDAVRDGYREGWYAGQADRADRWQFDYRNNYGWVDGSYGYSGRYVSQSDYRWYFRQGFERGYQDGYYGRYQYGRSERDGAMILPAILGMILAFSVN